MTTKLLVLFYASAMAVAIAGEAPSVSGSVKDPQGRPVAGAALSLSSRASSASGGDYQRHARRVSFRGRGGGRLFAARRGSRVRGVSRRSSARRARRWRATSRLQVAGVREQVVVTASGTSQSADEVSKSVTVIDRTEAEQRDVFALSERGGPGAGGARANARRAGAGGVDSHSRDARYRHRGGGRRHAAARRRLFCMAMPRG